MVVEIFASDMDIECLAQAGGQQAAAGGQFKPQKGEGLRLDSSPVSTEYGACSYRPASDQLKCWHLEGRGSLVAVVLVESGALLLGRVRRTRVPRWLLQHVDINDRPGSSICPRERETT